MATNPFTSGPGSLQRAEQAERAAAANDAGQVPTVLAEPGYDAGSSDVLPFDIINQPAGDGGKRKKKRKGLRKLAPAYMMRQSMKGMKSAAGKAGDLVRGGGRPGRDSLRRDSVDPIQLAAGTASRETRRQTRELEALPEEEKVTAPGAASRTVHLALGQPAHKKAGFLGNNVKTAKYNVVTFLPIFLFEMFSRVAYLYFLAQAALSWWSVVSPFSGFGSTAALAFVLIVAAIKALLEDGKRHQEDRRTNKSVAHVMQPDGTSRETRWEKVKVGQVLKVEDNELFPADLLCLYTSLPDKVCFIKTTNLDGESNLKIRRPVDLKENAPSSPEEAMQTRGILQCEVPNANLHQFKGRFQFVASQGASEARAVPVTMNEMLLRGCMLKNTGSVLGLVVYTGREARIQMNAAKTPNKIGSYDRFLNLQIGFVITMQICMCLFCAVASYVWREHMGRSRYYLAFDSYVQGNYSNGFVYTIILLITFWVLFSYLVPISLFVSLEIVKFWQAFLYINNDREMRDPLSGEFARARNSNLNEDLGKVEYVFSDKTGTLTSNEMQLRELAIKGVPFGDAKAFKLEQEPDVTGDAALQRFDPRLVRGLKALRQDGWWEELVNSGGSPLPLMELPSSNPGAETLSRLTDQGHMGQGLPDDPAAGDLHGMGSKSESFATTADEGEGADDDSDDEGDGAVEAGYNDVILGHHALDFWLNICICHSLIVEQPKNGGLPTYQGPSPDEVALVEAGRQLGFEFVSRSASSVVLRMAGHKAEFEVLNMMEFTSERGRMSVIARAPDGTIRLYSKGSDAKMTRIARPGTSKELLRNMDKNLHLFATQGLRTLMLGQKVLDEDAYAEWDAKYQAAAGTLDNRDAQLAACATEIETDLELTGVTAIEDKLQEGVPAAIQSLLDAGMKVWVITGDKQETAINIAIACRLIRAPDSLLVCNADSTEAASRRIEELLRMMQGERSSIPEPPKPKPTLLQHLQRLSEGLQDDEQPARSAKARLITGELVIDGKTLEHVLHTPLEQRLALLGSHCESVVICRASPSQKAAIVRMMTKFEVELAVRGTKGVQRWLKTQHRRLSGKMLGIGDGANDVAMIQAADVGIGIMGKEGRQAVNNSDYAIGQFRFLVRLLLVHGTLSSYRLARLIKYSFYKNIAFAFLLFFFQFYNGFSGQALVDGISAAAYNVIFTSVPILLYAVLDRPVRSFTTLMRYPQVYNRQGSLNTRVFWKSGVFMAFIDAALAFFIPYYTVTASDKNSITDVYSLGKVSFIALLGAVNLEVALVARYWTWLFGVFVLLSYWVVYPFEIIFSAIERGVGYYDPGQYGVAEIVFASPTFWFCQIVVYICCFGHRYLERAIVWLFLPQDNMILQEIEKQRGVLDDMGWQTKHRLQLLGVRGVGPPTDPEDPRKLESSGLLVGDDGLKRPTSSVHSDLDALDRPTGANGLTNGHGVRPGKSVLGSKPQQQAAISALDDRPEVAPADGAPVELEMSRR